MVNNVIGMVNYVIAARPSLLNFVIADNRGVERWCFIPRASARGGTAGHGGAWSWLATAA